MLLTCKLSASSYVPAATPSGTLNVKVARYRSVLSVTALRSVPGMSPALTTITLAPAIT